MENFVQNLAFLELQGLHKCLEAYKNNCVNMHISQIGFNPNSGYVYIGIEDNGISICSMLGRDVEYLVTDFETGEEEFFDQYEQAEKHNLFINI